MDGDMYYSVVLRGEERKLRWSYLITLSGISMKEYSDVQMVSDVLGLTTKEALLNFSFLVLA